MEKTSLLEFANKMNEIMPVIMKEFARRQTCELFRGKITLPQFLILNFLDREGNCRMTDLAHFMHVTTANMTGIVNRLVKSGYALRVFEPEDRRIIKIRLSSKGSGLVKKILEQRHKMIIKIFGKISEADRQDYLRVLIQIKEILTRE